MSNFYFNLVVLKYLYLRLWNKEAKIRSFGWWMLMIDKHKFKQKYNNFGYHSTKFWLKGNNISDQGSIS